MNPANTANTDWELKLTIEKPDAGGLTLPWYLRTIQPKKLSARQKKKREKQTRSREKLEHRRKNKNDHLNQGNYRLRR